MRQQDEIKEELLIEAACYIKGIGATKSCTIIGNNTVYDILKRPHKITLDRLFKARDGLVTWHATNKP